MTGSPEVVRRVVAMPLVPFTTAACGGERTA